MKITLDAILSLGKFQAVPWQLFAPRYWPTWLGLALWRLVAVLPFSTLLVVGRNFGRALKPVLTKFKRTARRNMELCLPDLTAQEREYLIGRHFESLGIGLTETA